jgi:hypothetical protein
VSRTEEEIRGAYERLDRALAPPADATARIGRRIAARKRRRRAAVATAALVAVGVVGAAALVGGDDRTADDRIAVDRPDRPTSTLVMTRPDGSTYAFDDVTVTCGQTGADAGDAPAVAPGRIRLTSPMELEGKGEQTTPAQPFVLVEGIVSKLQGDRTLELPVDGPGGSDSYPLVLFVADPQAGRSNEVSSAEQGAAGTVRVLRASCDPTPVLELEVDATLGSEVEQGTLDLAGSVR